MPNNYSDPPPKATLPAIFGPPPGQTLEEMTGCACVNLDPIMYLVTDLARGLYILACGSKDVDVRPVWRGPMRDGP